MKLKYKKYLYTLLILLILSIITPTFCFALDEKSIYVWSGNNKSIETSTTPSNEEFKENDTSDSRKFFRDYIWKRYFNGSKNWSSSL